MALWIASPDGTWSFSSVLLAPEMEPQGFLRMSVVPGTHASPDDFCRTLCQVAQGLPRTATHKDCLSIFSPKTARCLGHFQEPDRPEGDGQWTCTCSSLPPEGLRRSSPCSAGWERSVRRLQAASLTRGQRCGPGNRDGERKANPQPKSHPERTLPPSQKWEALGQRPDLLVHPIFSSNFPAEPALESSVAQARARSK